MISLLKRVRWAIALAVLQGVIFVTIGVVEHKRHVVQSHQPKGSTIEYFGCTPLPSKALTREERELLFLGVDCWNPLHIKVVHLTNLPVMLIWAAAASLTYGREVNKVWLFYGINGVGIPLFWYWIGTRIDRRLRRVRAPNHSKGLP